MKARYFLTGTLAGAALMLVGLSQHHGTKLDTANARHAAVITELAEKHGAQLDRAWYMSLEECPELETQVIQLMEENLELRQALFDATIKCKFLLKDCEKSE